MAANSAGGGRLQEFLSWAVRAGLEEDQVAELERVGADLFELAGGGRVTESHILHLIDAAADGPDARRASALVEEVGELLLRFQATRRRSGPAATVPQPGAPVRPMRQAASQPFVTRPEERVAGELRPPVQSADHMPLPLVSFAPGSAPPPAPGSGSSPQPPAPGGAAWTAPRSSTPAPAEPQTGARLPSGETPSTPPAGPTRRSSATLFRCRPCQAMVERTPAGTCPRCGTPAPSVSAPHASVARARRPRWLVPAVAALALLAGVALAGPPLLDRLHHPSEAVAGEYRSEHLGASLRFPAAWRHLHEEDAIPGASLEAVGELFADPLAVRTSHFFRGAASHPDAELFVVVGGRAPALGDAALAAWAGGVTADPVRLQRPLRSLTGRSDVHMIRCGGGALPHGAVRCSVEADHTPGFVYVWTSRTAVSVALFLGEAAPGAALAESASLIGGIEIGR